MDKIYAWRNNLRLLGATSKSWGATLVRKSKIALYIFWKLVYAYEIKYNMVRHIPKYIESNSDHGQSHFNQQNNMWKIKLKNLWMFPNVRKIEFLGY